MRAVVAETLGPPEALRVRELPDPEPGRGEIRVAVRAAGVNFADSLIIEGRYQVRAEPPFVPGAELAGVVDAIGPGVRQPAVGDRVLATVPHGAFAEKAVVPAEAAVPIPDGIDDETAAVLPIVYPTSYAALALRAGLRRGETLLVHAAAGGVGLAAVQIGKALGARVFGTAGGPEKCEVVRSAGAELAIDYRAEDFRAAVMEATRGRGVDVVYDPVGGDTTDESIRCLAWNGRLLVVGFASGTIPAIRANRILLRNIGVLGLHWPAWRDHDPEGVRTTFDAIFRMVQDGSLAPRIADRVPLERAPDAIRAVASRATTGKIVVLP